jgi:hypothetical protein
MGGYRPVKITGFETGLVQEREEFLLVEDAFPILENAYVWREKIVKKRGKDFFGRLRRLLTAQSFPVTAASPYTIADMLTTLGLRASETNAEIECGSVVIVFGSGGANETTIEDAAGDGTFALQSGSADPMGFTSGTINYVTGAVSISFSALAAGETVDIDFNYFPALPCMGLRQRELNGINDDDTVAFDTKYAYVHSSLTNWQELAPGTTWSGSNSDFFWTVNWFVDANNNKLFFATNFTSGAAGDPMRFFDGTAWNNFAPAISATDSLFTARILVPVRGRLLALNTFEGATGGGLAGATQNQQRIRWSQIGSPILADSWRQDIRGKGSFLDIPTSEAIVAAGFVRDNLVIYCERSTWQLRYVGRDISPFQIERVNMELGAESTFSAIQFDKSLVGVGDKRIVSCDSFNSEPIDIKIPDFAINIENDNDGPKRVHGVRDIEKRLTYWTYPSTNQGEFQDTFPNRILLYNYENDSWAILKDSITCFGYLWLKEDPVWLDLLDITWQEYEDTWATNQNRQQDIVAGNQQGYICKYNEFTSNQQSLAIFDITGNTTTPTVVTCIDHNLNENDVIEIINIPTGSAFENLNNGIFSVTPLDADTFQLFTFREETDSWDEPQLDAPATYIGCGEIKIRDNIRIVTKKFHHMDEGQKIQIGYFDCLFTETTEGEVKISTYVDHLNDFDVNDEGDSFFNFELSTSASDLDIPGARKYWQRVFCPISGNFLQIEFTLGNSQMNSVSAISEIELHALIVWERMAGRLTI